MKRNMCYLNTSLTENISISKTQILNCNNYYITIEIAAPTVARWNIIILKSLYVVSLFNYV